MSMVGSVSSSVCGGIVEVMVGLVKVLIHSHHHHRVTFICLGDVDVLIALDLLEGHKLLEVSFSINTDQATHLKKNIDTKLILFC